MKTPSAQELRQAYETGLQAGKALQSFSVPYYRDVARCTARVLGWPMETLLQKVRGYHQERLDAVPDLRIYPELEGARELLLEKYRGMGEAGLDPDTIAVLESFNFWRDVRLVQETGKAWHVMPVPEECRVLYVPETSRGPLHAKNVDGPLTYWKPEAPIPQGTPWPFSGPLVFDGVGSGLHLDEVPPEIFPVDVIGLCRKHCSTVPQATEFLVRYNFFWGGCNLLVHDQEGRSMAFEKTRCRVATRGPGRNGLNFITGMGALDPGLRAFQNAQREKYLAQIGKGTDYVDAHFWRICQGQWDRMARYVEQLSESPTVEGAFDLMEKRDADGPMCMTGEKCHPDETDPSFTVQMRMHFMRERVLHRRQWRGNTPVYLDPPEIVRHAG